MFRDSESVLKGYDLIIGKFSFILSETWEFRYLIFSGFLGSVISAFWDFWAFWETAKELWIVNKELKRFFSFGQLILVQKEGNKEVNN